MNRLEKLIEKRERIENRIADAEVKTTKEHLERQLERVKGQIKVEREQDYEEGPELLKRRF